MNQNGKKRWPHRALILACAVIAVLPLAVRGSSCGHDFDFHLQSWLAVAQRWRQGGFYPHWIEYANYAAGEPRFVFYPPISWMLGAFLVLILPWAATPIAFTFVVLTACGFSMSKLAGEWLPAWAATAAACAFILNPYTLFVAYERTAYAELTAGIWLPLIVLYALRNPTKASHIVGSRDAEPSPEAAYSKDLQFSASSIGPSHPDSTLNAGTGKWKDQRFQRTFTLRTIPLALTITAIWLTNAPAAVMACYSLAAITLWKAIGKKQWQPILHSTASLLLGLGLAAFYLVPAAYERRWVDIARAIDPGMRVEDSFLFGTTGQSFHDQVLHSASWVFVTMLATIAIAIWVAQRRKVGQSFILPACVTAAVLFVVQLRFSDPLWRLAPELRFLQFPWRWSLVLSIVFALAIGAASTPRSISPGKLRLYAITILAAAAAFVSVGSHLFWQPCDDEDAVSAQLALFKSGAGFEGTDEYTPTGADNSILPQGLPKLRLLDDANAEIAVADANQDDGNPTYIPSDKDHLPLQARIEQWRPEDKTLTVTTRTSGFAVLRLMDYPVWKVLANGAPVLNRPHREDGLMTIPIPAGQTRIEISYLPTPDVWWGRGLTAASLLALFGFAAAGRKRRDLSYHE